MGEWLKCDDGWIGEELIFDKYDFYDTTNFTVKSSDANTVAIKLCFKIKGKP